MEKNTTKNKIRRKFKGKVISDAADKTIVVEVKRTKVHPKYLKRFSVSKKYKVHDPENRYKIGDVVAFVECRPISRQKRWRVI